MRCFIDTNIFVYAYGEVGHPKRSMSIALLRETMDGLDNEVVVSYQVIQEFCNVMLTKKAQAPEVVANIVAKTMATLAQNTTSAEFYTKVIELFKRYKLSFYDACILQAAIDLDCNILYTEDFQDGQQFDQVRISNPFK